MMGLVLWYNPVPGVGMVWCEDQGPLAFLGPELRLPEGTDTLHCGDQLVFSYELREGVRHVRDVVRITASAGGQDPREIIASFHDGGEGEGRLRVVA